MNKQFSEEQIEVYASAFEEGDAIWSDGKWHEVFHEGDSLSIVSLNQYHIKNLYGEGVINGFKNVLESSGVPYRITTLKDYELQGGERAIWLGQKYRNNLTFGWSYDINISKETGHPVFRGNDGVAYIAEESEWGIIPRYEQVALQNKQEDSTFTVLEQKLVELRKECNELQKNIPDKQGYERKLAEVVINLEETIDSFKKIGDV